MNSKGELFCANCGNFTLCFYKRHVTRFFWQKRYYQCYSCGRRVMVYDTNQIDADIHAQQVCLEPSLEKRHTNGK